MSADDCVIYGRTSDDAQSTTPEQERWGRGKAGERGWRLAGVFIDEGLSGDDEERPALNRMIDFLRARKQEGRPPITRLITEDTDRVSRADSDYTGRIKADLRDAGLRYVLVKLPEERLIDLTDPMSRTFWSITQDHGSNPLLWRSAKRTLNAMAEVASAGNWIGRIPTGYKAGKPEGDPRKKRKAAKLVKDEDTAPIVEELFKMAARGESTGKLAKWLTQRVKPRQAPAWSCSTVRQLLTNEAYVGTVRFGARSTGKRVQLGKNGGDAQTREVPEKKPGASNGRRKCDGPKRKATPRTRSPETALVVRNAHPAIVTEQLFEDVQKQLARGKRHNPQKETEPLPLAGLGRCGHCGGTLHCVLAMNKARLPDGTRSRSRRIQCSLRTRYGAEKCPQGSTSASHDEVLKEVLATLADHLLADDVVERITKAAEEQASQARERMAAERDALLNRLGEIDKALRRAQGRLLEVDRDMLDDVQAAIRQRRAERDQVQAQVEELAKEREAPPPLDPARVVEFFTLCREACSMEVESASPAFHGLLRQLIEGFRVFFKEDWQGRKTFDRVDVDVPRWLLLLGGRGWATCSARRSARRR